MTRTIFGKVVWAGRATVFLMGLAMVLALALTARAAGAEPCADCDPGGGGDGGGNSAPTVGVDNSSMTVSEGQRVTNTGTYSDSETGDVAIEVWVSGPGRPSERCGTVTKTGTNSGTWSWASQSGEGAINPLDPVRCNDDGPFPLSVTVVARDSEGAEGQGAFTMTVDNVAPRATLNEFGQNAWREGEPRWFYQSYSNSSPLDPSHADRAAGFQVAYDCGEGYDAWRAGVWQGYWIGNSVAGYNESGRVCGAAQDSGTREVSAKIKDKDGGVGERTETVTIENVAPTATFNAPGSVDEGGNFAISLTDPQDPSPIDRESLRYAFDCGSGYGTPSSTNTASCTSVGGSRTVKGKIIDKDGGETEYTREVTVNNIAPRINRVVPAENATGIAPGANVSAFFSEAMKVGSININTVKLFKKGSTTALPAQVNYDGVAKKGVLNPDSNLQRGATYKAVVTTGAKDKAGNRLDQDPSVTGNQPKVWFFTVKN